MSWINAVNGEIELGDTVTVVVERVRVMLLGTKTVPSCTFPANPLIDTASRGNATVCPGCNVTTGKGGNGGAA